MTEPAQAKSPRQSKLYGFESKDLKVFIQALDRKAAWKKFYARVVREGWARKLGLVVIMKPPDWKSKDDDIGMRTPEILYLMGQITGEEAVEWISSGVGISKVEAVQMFTENLETTKWAIPDEIGVRYGFRK